MIFVFILIKLLVLVSIFVLYDRVVKKSPLSILEHLDFARTDHVYVLINSHNKSKVALEWLLRSVYSKTNDSNLRILIVVGGAPNTTIYEETERNESCPRVYRCYVKHNSIDFTGMLALIEYQEEINKLMGEMPDRWFYMHDTCELEDYKRFANRFKETTKTTRLLTTQPSMNMGIYTHKDILKSKKLIMEHRSTNNPTVEEIHELKQRGVVDEDAVFKALQIGESMSGVDTLNERFSYPGSTVKRIIEVYRDVGLKKYKANFAPSQKYVLEN